MVAATLLHPHKLIPSGKICLHPLHESAIAGGAIRFDQEEVEDLAQQISTGAVASAVVQVEELPKNASARAALFERVGHPVALATGADSDRATYWVVGGLATVLACAKLKVPIEASITKLEAKDGNDTEGFFRTTLDRLKVDYRRDDNRVTDYRIGAILIGSGLSDKAFSERTKIDVLRVGRSRRTYLAAKEFGVDPEASGLTDFGITAMRSRLAPRTGDGHSDYQSETLHACIRLLAEEGRHLSNLVRFGKHVNQRSISKDIAAAIAEHAYLLTEREQQQQAKMGAPSYQKMPPAEIAKAAIDAIFWRIDFADARLVAIAREGGISYYEFRRASRMSPTSQAWLADAYDSSSEAPLLRKLTDGNFRNANDRSRAESWNKPEGLPGEDDEDAAQAAKPKKGLAGVFQKWQRRALSREAAHKTPTKDQPLALKVGPTSQAKKILEQAGIRDFSSVVWLKNPDGTILIRPRES